jgi:hypothetical protein
LVEAWGDHAAAHGVLSKPNLQGLLYPKEVALPEVQLGSLPLGTKRTFEPELPFEDLAKSLGQAEPSGGSVDGIYLVAEIGFIDERGPHKSTSCFSKRATQINTPGIADLVFKAGSMAACDAAARGIFAVQ